MRTKKIAAILQSGLKAISTDPQFLKWVPTLLKENLVALAEKIALSHVLANPNDSAGHAYLAEIYMHCLPPGVPMPEAVADLINFHLDESLRLSPDSVNALNLKATWLRTTGDFEAAQATYERIIETYPDYAPAHFNLALLYLESQPGKALEHFEQGAQIEPDDTDYVLGCAKSLIALDRKPEALDKLVRAEHINPQDQRIAMIRSELSPDIQNN